MARRPLLPYRMTMYLAIIAGLVAWAGATRAAEAVLPGSAAIAVGVIVGVVALVVVPAVLGRPDTAPLVLGGTGAFAIVVGFISQLDNIGLAVALAIFVPATAVLVALVLLVRRVLVPAQR